MILVVRLFGFLLLFAGLSLLIKPEIIFNWIENNMESTVIYISAIIVRLFFGVLFLTIAKKSRFPGVIRVFGILLVIAALIFLFIGHELFIDFIQSIIPEFSSYARLIGLIVIAFGGFLIYVFSKKPNNVENII
ncbi:MAG: hypothetical protein HKO81_02330 [Flavobacteriaceae bacterium]|nr:hypothetical protein [Bacteroidia bacterium]NNL15463.1 hypothetical protein [Flavobacteriaceae bacterium]